MREEGQGQPQVGRGPLLNKSEFLTFGVISLSQVGGDTASEFFKLIKTVLEKNEKVDFFHFEDSNF